jgi:hypothetical protein
MRRPCQITRCEKIVHSRLGSSSATTCSILTGSVSPVQPKRRTNRWKWVSTVSPGTPNALPSTTLAVLRPTPGSLTRSISLPGTSPPCRSQIACAMPMMLLVFARKNPVERMISSTSVRSAAA